jgi:hypothetical protein
MRCPTKMQLLSCQRGLRQLGESVHTSAMPESDELVNTDAFRWETCLGIMGYVVVTLIIRHDAELHHRKKVNFAFIFIPFYTIMV